MSIWDEEPLAPIEELHDAARLIALDCEIREAEVKLECLRWWAANPARYLSMKKWSEARPVVALRGV